MQLHCDYTKYTLHFTFDAGTSRGILRERTTYFIRIYDSENPELFGIGECGPLKGLSPDDRPDLEAQLKLVCARIEKSVFPEHPDQVKAWLQGQVAPEWPAVRFGIETAMLDFLLGGQRKILDNPWSESPFQPIPINGLIWMGSKDFMKKQMKEKLDAGYTCIKMKIGAIDFDTELSLLSYLRNHYDTKTLTLRVDANGAFTPEGALAKLEALSKYDIHSIEQPVQPKQPETLYHLCRESPVPIALDEELIGITDAKEKLELLQQIRPQYIILKPTLLGGIAATKEWIALANQEKAGWWITSALESNLGLNAIAQLTASLQVNVPQGLGTGQLYHNNVASPLFIENGSLKYNPDEHWDLETIHAI